ncbi:serum response factor-like isoform X3 [Girardinichthys multiradiatus]|uniref:serum response factor-like isoform X3 n=1 Tax=Girardinichthys multiradiatus TaxID=208333 RepID=UPI001FACC07C|nr:serum response factor-like isoform X3 [Girardinichthys multiradiatus]
MATRTGSGSAGNGLGNLPVSTAEPEPSAGRNTDGDQYGEQEYSTEVVYSGSDQDSDSGDDEDAVGSGGDRRGVKRERSEDGRSAKSSGGLNRAYSGGSPAVSGAKPGKKTRGRVKIKMEFIDNKLRRYTTFSKRKTGIMKKAYELSTLTGTQVLLLVASETGHVYTFATRKLQPMITSETGKALIQTCLNSPDSPPRSDPSTDQRMSATGFEETDLTYQVAEIDSSPESSKVQTSATSWQPPTSSSNGTVLKTSAGVVLPGGITLMSGAQLPPGTHTIPLSQLQGQPVTIQGPTAAPTATLQTPSTQTTTLLRLPATVSLTGTGVSQQLQTIQVQPSSQQTSNQSGSGAHSPASSSTASLPVTIVSSSSSSSSSVAGHMMYPSGHTVMYATSTPSLADRSLAVLNTFPPGHTQSHDPGAVQQVFLTSLPPVAGQIPLSAVQLHPMVISQPNSSSSLTELQVVSLDVHQSKDD